MSGRAPTARDGFTLIEMMVVVMFTAIVMLVAVDFFLQLGRATTAATERTREGRRATGILDRVARDLQSTVLVAKPDETDPLEHPWVFVAEAGRGSEGAERLLFVSRGRVSRSSSTHESDLERVAYFLSTDEDGTTSLMRWSSPRLPDGLERELPRGGEEDAVVLARDVARFGVRFLDEEGAWSEEWDSSALIRSSELPMAAEISVAVYGEQVPEGDDLEAPEPMLWSRLIELPVRPIDLVALLDPEAAELAAGDDEDDENGDGEDGEDGGSGSGGMTVAQCMALIGINVPLPGVDLSAPVQMVIAQVPQNLREQYDLGRCIR